MPWRDYVTLLATAPAAAGSGNTPAWISALVAASTLTLGILAVLLRMGWNVVTRTRRLLDDLLGEPARQGVPERPGVMARLQGLTEEIAKVRAQVIPDGGGASLRDAVDRLSADLAEHRHLTGPAITQLTGDVAELRRRVELFEHERSVRDELKA